MTFKPFVFIKWLRSLGHLNFLAKIKTRAAKSAYCQIKFWHPWRDLMDVFLPLWLIELINADKYALRHLRKEMKWWEHYAEMTPPTKNALKYGIVITYVRYVSFTSTYLDCIPMLFLLFRAGFQLSQKGISDSTPRAKSKKRDFSFRWKKN